MSKHFIRPYVRGAVTPKGWSVVCVPGMRVSEVVEPLATRLANLVLAGRLLEARGLMLWFGGEYVEDDDGVETDEPLSI